MKKCLTISIALLACALWVPASALAVGGGTITGTITDAGSGEPLAGTTACAETSSGSSYGCDTSDEDGTYTIAGLQQGSYKVEFFGSWIETGPGEYKRLSYVRQYYDGKASWNAADPVSVASGATTGGIDAAMVEGAEVEGTVSDGTNPLEGVEVCAYLASSGKESGCAHSDEEGHYLIVGIPDGNYKIGFFPSENSVYAPQYYDGKSSLATADPVALAAGAKATGIDAALTEAGKIAGTVTKAGGGGAIQGVQVCAERSEGSPRCATTDAAGEYTIVGLLSGQYTVRFGSVEYLPQYYSDKASAFEATQITVEDGVTKSGIDAQLSAAARIEGNVTAADTAKAISGVEVCAVKTTAFSYFPGQVCGYSDGDGDYTISGLGTGSYDVRFNAGYGEISPGEYGPRNYLIQYYAGAATRTQATPVATTAATVTSGIDATLQPGGQITGTVTDAVTHNGVQAMVCALPSRARGGTERCATSSSSDGTYTIKGLPTDQYKVRFSAYASNISYLSQFFNGKATKKEAASVAVSAGAVTSGIDAAMHEGGAIAGTVTDAGTHAPLQGIDVCAGGFCDATAADGTYEVVGLKSGSYRLQFSGREGTASYATAYYHDKLSWEEAQKVTVVAGAVTAGVDQEMHEGGRISGTVLDAASEEPLEGIRVCATDPDSFASRCAQTDELGEYEILGLQPGSYRVRFSRFSPWDPDTAKYAPQYFEDAALPADATRVEVGFGETATDVDAEMQEGGSIDGLVSVASTHAPQGGVGVCALPEEEGEEEIELCTQTDAHGEYTLKGLATGSYAIAFFPGWMAPFESPNLLRQYYDGSPDLAGAEQVAVIAGTAIHEIDAELQPGGTISGVVTAAGEGSRLEGIEVCAYGTEGEEPSTSCSTSNAHGEYTIAKLPTGTYTVRFSALVYDWEGSFEEEGSEPEPEEEFLTQYWKGASSLGAATAIPLTAGQSVDGIDAQMVWPGPVPPPGPPPADGGSSSGSGAAQSSPPSVTTPPAAAPPRPKALHCRKGFKKKRMHGKTRCVKVPKHQGKKHHRSR